MRQPSGHGTRLSLRPYPTSSPIWSTSLASLSLKCSTGQGGAGPTLSLPSCLMPETESSALVITTAPSTPRSTAHTEQGLPVPARRLQSPDQESLKNVQNLFSQQMFLQKFPIFRAHLSLFPC